MKVGKLERIFDVVNICFMVFMMIITLYPFIYVLLASLSKPSELMAHTGLLLKPLGFSLSAYKSVFMNPNVAIGFKNTITILSLGVALNVILTCMGGYFLSRKNVMLKNPIMVMIIFTMFFSGGLIPDFLLVRGIGINNSLIALILPKAINTTNLIILMTAFVSIPDSMEEAARIDGANDFTILFKIMIPLVFPTIAVIMLYYGVAHWNSWFDAVIYLQNTKLHPMQLVLRKILIQNDTNAIVGSANVGDIESIGENIKYALIIVSTVPILLLYPFLQKYFVKGIMIGAIKG